jgi:hypothetical protein
MYVIKNDDGKYWGFAGWTAEMQQATTWMSRKRAEAFGDAKTVHVVELVEKPKLVEVSDAEAKELQATATGEKTLFGLLLGTGEGGYDRIARAYVNGYTVRKPKRYVLPMEFTEYHNLKKHGDAQYYATKTGSNWRPDAIALGTDDAVEHGYTVTDADLKDAPKWVKAIDKVEVKD